MNFDIQYDIEMNIIPDLYDSVRGLENLIYDDELEGDLRTDIETLQEMITEAYEFANNIILSEYEEDVEEVD